MPGKKIERNGAIYHIFERLGRASYQGLDIELRGILKEKGLRIDDPFDEIVTRSWVIDLEKEYIFEEVVEKVAGILSKSMDMTFDEIKTKFEEGSKLGATPVIRSVALPHFRSKYIKQTEMVLVRSKKGVQIKCENPIMSSDMDVHTVFALFFLVSPDDNPTQHLRILAQIAGRVEDDSFSEEWFEAKNEQKLKEALLHDDKFVSIKIRERFKSEVFINSMLREMYTPVGCLVAMLQRKGRTIIPNGNTVFEEGDRLTIIGDKKGLNEFKKRYIDE
ncbi:PTS sugar transporter subunit IIA [Bacteroidota bacterium]